MEIILYQNCMHANNYFMVAKHYYIHNNVGTVD